MSTEPVISTPVRSAWLSGPLALAGVLLYMLIGLPVALSALMNAGLPFGMSLAVPLVPLLLFFFASLWSMELRAGADGVLLRWLGWTRFLPYRDLRACEAPDGEIGAPDGTSATMLVLRLRNGGSIKVRDGRLGFHGTSIRQAAELVHRIRAGIAAAERDVPDDAARDLERGPKPVRGWLDELSRRAQNKGYREAALDREALLKVAESAFTPPTARVGAAAILRKSGLLDEERQRLRIVAGATVAPRVRIALEAATEAELSEADFDEAAARAARS